MSTGKNITNKKNLHIVFQGCGAHDAFSWGVVDRLLEDGRFNFASASGHSLSALIALSLAQHAMDKNVQDVREHLRHIWQTLSKNCSQSILHKRGPMDRMMGRFSMNNSPGYVMFDYLNRLFSPYDLNPLDINPVMESAKKLFDFKKIQSSSLKISLSAISVDTGRVKYFEQKKLSLANLEASVCNPEFYQAVKIDGHPHWGTHSVMNPDLNPILKNQTDGDLLVIWQMPFTHKKTPKTQREIHDRKENIQAYHHLKNQLDFYQKTAMHRVHIIQDPETFGDLGWSSKFNMEWEFLMLMMDKGRHAADRWIKLHGADVGITSSLTDEFKS